MNNFIFENAAKVYFGKGCVKEYLCCKVRNGGDTVMLAYGRGFIKKNGIYEEVVSILKPAADSCVIVPGTYKKLTHKEIYEILKKCF